jgi:hypothetical protein
MVFLSDANACGVVRFSSSLCLMNVGQSLSVERDCRVWRGGPTGPLDGIVEELNAMQDEVRSINFCSSFTSSLENREYGRRDPSRWPRDTIYPQKLALISPTSGGRSVGVVRSRAQATEFSFFYFLVVSHTGPWFVNALRLRCNCHVQECGICHSEFYYFVQLWLQGWWQAPQAVESNPDIQRCFSRLE